MNCPKPGYYVLTADVRNPKADRRCRGFMNVPVWKAGTRVKIGPRLHAKKADADAVATNDSPLLSEGIIECIGGGDYVLFGDGEVNYGSQGNGILDHIQEEPERLGYVLRECRVDSWIILARMLETNALTMGQIKAVAKELADWSEGKLESVGKMHGI